MGHKMGRNFRNRKRDSSLTDRKDWLPGLDANVSVRLQMLAWEEDLHYGLTKWIAYKVGFSLADAETIALARRLFEVCQCRSKSAGSCLPSQCTRPPFWRA